MLCASIYQWSITLVKQQEHKLVLARRTNSELKFIGDHACVAYTSVSSWH